MLDAVTKKVLEGFKRSEVATWKAIQEEIAIAQQRFRDERLKERDLANSQWADDGGSNGRS